MTDISKLKELAKLIRYYILVSTTTAGSGHPTSSLSGVELMTTLLFGGIFRFDLKRPGYPNNDRLIFSKGHASPLFYALWAAAGALSEKDLLTYRKFGSPLEGHPTPVFPYTEAATGSLGQGLPIGVGMALNAKLDRLPYRTYVLLGDSEMAEGSQWEAIQLAAHYKLDNLVGILDVNRLGQRGPTMYGHDLKAYEKRITAFGWKTIVVNGHNFNEILKAFRQSTSPPAPPHHLGRGRPVMIIAKTLKGKGVSFLENKDGWHGKALPEKEFRQAVRELGKINKKLRGEVEKPEKVKFSISNSSPFGGSPAGRQIPNKSKIPNPNYKIGEEVATRKAYGNALVRIFPKFPQMVVLDAEVSNSTYAEIFKEKYPERFLEMFVAEQNMVGTALGLSRRGKIPFVSSFAAFLTRAFDQIRMSQYSKANIKFCGSHAGVSIGEDGPSQMGLEDLAMFRTLLGSVVLYPSDAVSTEKLVEAAAKHKGIVYIRTTRAATPVVYSPSPNPSPQGRGKEKNYSSPSREEDKEGVKHHFRIGGSCVLKSSRQDVATVAAAGITLHEALAAYEELKKQGIFVRVIDLYSIKPLDRKTLLQAAKDTGTIITVEDHYAEGGIGEAVKSVVGSQHPVVSLAVRKMPKSGKPQELLDYEEISRSAIMQAVKRVVSNKL